MGFETWQQEEVWCGGPGCKGITNGRLHVSVMGRSVLAGCITWWPVHCTALIIMCGFGGSYVAEAGDRPGRHDDAVS